MKISYADSIDDWSYVVQIECTEAEYYNSTTLNENVKALLGRIGREAVADLENEKVED